MNGENLMLMAERQEDAREREQRDTQKDRQVTSMINNP